MTEKASAAQQPAASIAGSLEHVEAAAWNAIANPNQATYNPFIDYAFLRALEISGCVGTGTGWHPRHILIEDEAGLTAAMPAYLKTHSQGEYVFDHSWADAYQRAGGHYYPKLQCAVPFTPVPGHRLLVREGETAADLRRMLAAIAVQATRQLEASSFHATFLTENEWNELGDMGFLKRTGQQFHFTNPGYRTFDDFLSELAARKRKAIRKERAQAGQGLTIRQLTGSEITEADWDAFFAFYIDTGSRKWGRPYLNREFFSRLGEAMSERCLLVFAYEHGRPIAGALNMIGGDCLYGRYWGACEQRPYMHFELCYYQAIDYAIAHAIPRVEAGAQGDHKLARGYQPVTTYSAHHIVDPALRRAIAHFLEHEREAIAEINEDLAAAGPFRKDE
ncbi:MAG: N-acetyltransferase [Bauldia sp.]|nr:N-acetyltransferase [Bauldia sp.]MCB1504019.1 N-acetyltransferase [Hyphomicrobiaceae bacterium]